MESWELYALKLLKSLKSVRWKKGEKVAGPESCLLIVLGCPQVHGHMGKRVGKLKELGHQKQL